MPVDGKVKELADKITEGKTTDLDKVKAIYDWTIANMNRDESVKGCGTGEVEKLLDMPQGKCTDIHSVFVALCRASGVPAREIFGVRMSKKHLMMKLKVNTAGLNSTFKVKVGLKQIQAMC